MELREAVNRLGTGVLQTRWGIVLNLVYSHWFIIRDTIVNENQPHHLIPLYIP
eukprot:SAG31_NODE_40450_length_280_cov_1.696133_1_plen_52_part_10